MKGIVLDALKSFTETKYDKDKWVEIITKSGFAKDKVFYGHHDIDDKIIMTLLTNTCSVLKVSSDQLYDELGVYWINDFTSKVYFAFFGVKKDAKSFILNINNVHQKLTEKIENANPPKFIFEEINNNTITMKYISARGLERFWIGIIKGVGIYFNENITIKNLEKNKVELTFSK